MYNNVIKNASPQIIQLGTDDKSILPRPPKPIIVGTHTPLQFFFAPEGPTTKEYMDPARALALYGADTFNRNKPYFNHATRMMELMASAGNNLMTVRVVPEDCLTIANTTIYLDVIKDDNGVVYQRNLDGSFATDAQGDKIVDPDYTATPVYRVKVIAVTEEVSPDTEMGLHTAKAGYIDGGTSTMLPIVEFRGSYQGEAYNNIGIGIHSPPTERVDNDIKDHNLSMPYEFYLFKRADGESSGVIQKSLFGTETAPFVFKKGAKHGATSMPVDLVSTMNLWSNTDNPLRDLVYPKVQDAHVYQDNLEGYLSLFMESEAPFIEKDINTKDGVTVNSSDWLVDFIDTLITPLDAQSGILNPFTCKSSSNVPYFTLQVDDVDVSGSLLEGHSEVYLSRATPLYLENGTDGTLSEANFEKEVVKWMDKYLDGNSEVMSSAVNLESVLYDSGFTLETKKELVSFIGLRKDTFLLLSTREDYLGRDKYVSLIEERAIAVVLKAAFGLAPESTFFGTPVARGGTVMGNGLDSLDPENNRYGLLHDIAYKTARLMGGQSWNKNLMFDTGGKNTILNYSSIQPSFIPQGIKPDLWSIGVIHAEEYDRESYFFPALQSIYDNDSSVLNNIFMGHALTSVNKVAAGCWRTFTGSTELKTGEFLAAVDGYMDKELEGKFDGVITATGTAMITEYDEMRGYSWTVVSKVVGNRMKTVMTHAIEAWASDSEN